MTFFYFFSHRPGFSNFLSLFPDFPDLYFVRYRTQPFPHKKNTFFPILAKKKFFLVIRQHYFSKYWGDECNGRSPDLKLWGDRPPSPPRFPPCQSDTLLHDNLLKA